MSQGLIWTRLPAGLYIWVIHAVYCIKPNSAVISKVLLAAYTSTTRVTAERHPAGQSVPPKGSAVPVEVQTWFWNPISHRCYAKVMKFMSVAK